MKRIPFIFALAVGIGGLIYAGWYLHNTPEAKAKRKLARNQKINRGR